MARNRKNESAAFRFGVAVKVLLLCLVIGGSGVGYVWQKDQILRLGKERKQREIRLGQLARENEKRRNKLSEMYGPAFLEARIKDLKLGLVLPQQAQIWRLPEPIPDQHRAPTPPAQYPARLDVAAGSH